MRQSDWIKSDHFTSDHKVSLVLPDSKQSMLKNRLKPRMPSPTYKATNFARLDNPAAQIEGRNKSYSIMRMPR